MISAPFARLQAPAFPITNPSTKPSPAAISALPPACLALPPIVTGPASLQPLFFADWIDTLMIHLAVPRAVLQPAVPLELDCIDGDGFVSLVAFRQRNLRPAWPAALAYGVGGRIGAALMRPLSAHDFLNVRTYVKHRGEAGIFFIAEVLSSRLATYLGPLLYGLPYSFGQVAYQHDLTQRELRGSVVQAHTGRRFRYRAELPRGLSTAEIAALPPSSPDSLDAFWMERYVAFTRRGGVQRQFRIWHEPWRQTRVQVELEADELAAGAGGWWPCAKVVCANASPGVRGVWIGPPEIEE